MASESSTQAIKAAVPSQTGARGGGGGGAGISNHEPTHEIVNGSLIFDSPAGGPPGSTVTIGAAAVALVTTAFHAVPVLGAAYTCHCTQVNGGEEGLQL